MAMYHFRIKSDKKPNGTKISAVKHVEYINREGAFFDDEHGQEIIAPLFYRKYKWDKRELVNAVFTVHSFYRRARLCHRRD